MENLISEGHKALNRKEEYIKHQEFIIDNLRQEKIDLETQLNEPVLESSSHQSEEIENYQTENKKLSAIIEDIERTLASTIELHNTDLNEKRYTFIIISTALLYTNVILDININMCTIYRERFKDLKILIATKNDVISRQNMMLNLMRDINE